MNISEACFKFLHYSEHTKKLSPLTIKAYEQDLSLLVELSGRNKPVQAVDRDTIRDCVSSLFDKGQSKATVKRRLACFKTLFKWLENEDLIEQTPFYRLDLKIKLPHRLPRNLNQHELKKMLKAAKNELGLSAKSKKLCFKSLEKQHISTLTLLVGLELLLTTGVRVSELTSIQLDDIHLDDRYIHIQGKGQRERRVFITSDNIKRLIKQYLHIRLNTHPQHDSFLINRLGRPATPQTMRLWMAKLSKKANLSRKATPHMYRHSAATNLLEAGVDIRYVQKLLGHQSITTTQIYTHVNNTELYEMIVKADIQGRVL